MLERLAEEALRQGTRTHTVESVSTAIACAGAARSIPRESVFCVLDAALEGGLFREDGEGLRVRPFAVATAAAGRVLRRSPELVPVAAADPLDASAFVAWAEREGTITKPVETLLAMAGPSSCAIPELLTLLLATSLPCASQPLRRAVGLLLGWWGHVSQDDVDWRPRLLGLPALPLLAVTLHARRGSLAAGFDAVGAVAAPKLPPVLGSYASALGLTPPPPEEAIVLAGLAAPGLSGAALSSEFWRRLYDEAEWGQWERRYGLSAETRLTWWRRAILPLLVECGDLGQRVLAGTAPGFRSSWTVLSTGGIETWWEAVSRRLRDRDDAAPAAIADVAVFVVERMPRPAREELARLVATVRGVPTRRRLGAAIVARLLGEPAPADEVVRSDVVGELMARVLLDEHVQQLWEAWSAGPFRRLPWRGFLDAGISARDVAECAARGLDDLPKRRIRFGHASLWTWRPGQSAATSDEDPGHQCLRELSNHEDAAVLLVVARLWLDPWSRWAATALGQRTDRGARAARLELAAEVDSTARTHLVRNLLPEEGEGDVWLRLVQACERPAPPVDDPQPEELASWEYDFRYRAQHALRFRLAHALVDQDTDAPLQPVLEMLSALEEQVADFGPLWSTIHDGVGDLVPLLFRAKDLGLPGLADLVRQILLLPGLRSAVMQWSVVWRLATDLLGWEEALAIVRSTEVTRRGASADYVSSLVRFGPVRALEDLLTEEHLHLALASAIVQMRGPAVGGWARRTVEEAAAGADEDADLRHALAQLAAHAIVQEPEESLSWFEAAAPNWPRGLRKEVGQAVVRVLPAGPRRVRGLALLLGT